MNDQLELPGLDGANPMAFLAALGLLSVGDRMVGPRAWRLSWRNRAVATPILHGAGGIDEILFAVMADREAWLSAPVLKYPESDLKFRPSDLRYYISKCRDAKDGGRSAALVNALVAEGPVDGKGNAKPSDLYFTAGQQKFVEMIRRIRDGMTGANVEEALLEPWRYNGSVPSLKWDIIDDRPYALGATDPSTTTKSTVPAAEWLALLGLASLPVFADGSRLATTGCKGGWKSGTFTWPNRSTPMSHRTAMSLIGALSADSFRTLPGWSVFRLYQSAIKRSDQGGYGTFSPPRPVWESETT